MKITKYEAPVVSRICDWWIDGTFSVAAWGKTLKTTSGFLTREPGEKSIILIELNDLHHIGFEASWGEEIIRSLETIILSLCWDETTLY